MRYPTIEQIKQADRLTVCRWWRFLPLDWGLKASNDDVDKALELQKTLGDRFKEVGGFTSEISKQIGWDQP